MIEGCLAGGGAKVVQAMRMEGLMDVVPVLKFPCRLSLKMGTLNRVLEPSATGPVAAPGCREETHGAQT